ncbi:MAG TPA: hypothetical protein VL172_23105, partial [Kofleriaceae bacterium]|nr:hypothetical protein [Kofleriaceae bacterium]
GADLALGRKLPALLRAAGLHQVSADAYLALAHPASALLEQMTVTLLRDALLGAGQVTAADLDAHLAALAAGELDVAQPALVSCRGRAPI